MNPPGGTDARRKIGATVYDGIMIYTGRGVDDRVISHLGAADDYGASADHHAGAYRDVGHDDRRRVNCIDGCESKLA